MSGYTDKWSRTFKSSPEAKALKGSLDVYQKELYTFEGMQEGELGRVPLGQPIPENVMNPRCSMYDEAIANDTHIMLR